MTGNYFKGANSTSDTTDVVRNDILKRDWLFLQRPVMSHEIFIEYTSPSMTQLQNEHACSGDFGQKISQNTANLAHLTTLGGSYWCSYYESLPASWKPLSPKSGFGLLLKRGFWLNFKDLEFYSPLGVVSMWPNFLSKKSTNLTFGDHQTTPTPSSWY